MRLEMFAAAENLEFEKAARMRDELKKLEALAGRNGAGDAKALASEVAAFEPYAAKKKKTKSAAPSARPAAKSAGARSRKWRG